MIRRGGDDATGQKIDDIGLRLTIAIKPVWRGSSCSFSRLYFSYFDVVSALIFQTRSPGFGSSRYWRSRRPLCMMSETGLTAIRLRSHV